MSNIWRIAYILAKPILMLIVHHSHRSRAVIWHDGKVLVIKNRLGDGKWVLPGGGLHKNESARIGTAREVREETGLDVSSNQFIPVGQETISFGWARFECGYFTVELTQPVETRKQWLEVSAVSWLNPDTLNAVNSGSEVLRGLELSGHPMAHLVQ